jgi:uncharacterized protein (TIGR00661 family)
MKCYGTIRKLISSRILEIFTIVFGLTSHSHANELKTVLIGVCGIGNGHIFNQLPVVSYLLSQGHRVAIFGFDSSYDYFSTLKKNYPNLFVFKVSTPFIPGDKDGLQFKKTAELKINEQNFIHTNYTAMADLLATIGKPDLVLTDYERVSAELAYAKNIPLITLDQQSKFLVGDLPDRINGTSNLDEIERIRLFFPKAYKRLATSFFKVNEGKNNNDDHVILLPNNIRKEIIELKKTNVKEDNTILVYFSPNSFESIPLSRWMSVLAKIKTKFMFHVFVPNDTGLPQDLKNVKIYKHGDPQFLSILARAQGIIGTAGHTLLSETMYLTKPMYALPLGVYEQQLNAYVIEINKFGISRNSLNLGSLKYFLANLKQFKRNIEQDTRVLNKEASTQAIINEIDNALFRRESKRG